MSARRSRSSRGVTVRSRGGADRRTWEARQARSGRPADARPAPRRREARHVDKPRPRSCRGQAGPRAPVVTGGESGSYAGSPATVTVPPGALPHALSGHAARRTLISPSRRHGRSRPTQPQVRHRLRHGAGGAGTVHPGGTRRHCARWRRRLGAKPFQFPCRRGRRPDRPGRPRGRDRGAHGRHGHRPGRTRTGAS